MASFVRLWPPAKTFCFAFNWFLQEEERRKKKRLVPELAALTQWESWSESGMERMKGNNFSVINLTKIRLILIIGTFTSAGLVRANSELNDLYEVISTSKVNNKQNSGGQFPERGNPNSDILHSNTSWHSGGVQQSVTWTFLHCLNFNFNTFGCHL